MKRLVVYYSWTGKTRNAAETLANEIKADLRALKEENSRKFLGFFFAALDAIRGKRSKLVSPDYDTSKYDLVLIGGPVWAGRPAPAILTFIDNVKIKGKKVIPFVTMGGDPGQSLNVMSGSLRNRGADVVYMLSIKTGGKTDDDVVRSAKEFSVQIKSLR